MAVDPAKAKKIILTSALIAGLVAIFSLLVGGTWEYSRSPEFCSRCHTMEFNTNTAARLPHAEVACTDCHLGVGFNPKMIMTKITELNQVVAFVTNSYEKPIRIKKHVPVQETCERCHWTEAFYDDRLVVNRTRLEDEASTSQRTALLMRVGGGASRDGQGFGIHWHVENDVFYATSKDGQVAAIKLNLGNSMVEYRQEGMAITDPVKWKRMDCADCHNRVAHRMPTPAGVADAVVAGVADADKIPYLKREVRKLLEQAVEMEANKWSAHFEQLIKFYQDNYSSVYNERERDITGLAGSLTEQMRNLVYPEMEVRWDSFQDNLTHQGCFRCHNGKTWTAVNAPPQSPPGLTISMGCQTCHSLPVVARGDQKLTLELP